MKHIDWSAIVIALIVLSIAGCTALVSMSTDIAQTEIMKSCLQNHTPTECDDAAPFFD